MPDRRRPALAATLLASAALALGAAAPAMAETSAAPTTTPQTAFAYGSESWLELRDQLFGRLAASRSNMEARAASNAIWRFWMQGPEVEATLQLAEAMRRRRYDDYDGAIAQLDGMIARWPDFAEPWNQRATLRFLRGEFEASLADVAEVLAREPRHFGALSGKGIILLQLGQTEEGDAAIRQALTLHPYLTERRLLTTPEDREL